MSAKDDGGSAFPQVKTEKTYTTDVNVHSAGGMSLRDYFAAKALSILLFQSASAGHYPAVAVAAYKVADAMIAERSQP